MPDLIAFLQARIGEDEALANECLLPENLRPYSDSRIPPIEPEQWGDLARNYLGGEMGEHCAQHNPLRVLAECAAKRAMLANIPKPTDVYDILGGTSEYVLRCMAAVHEKHPDYDPAWG